MYSVSYNGVTSKDLLLYATRPSIPAPEVKYKEYAIPGRDGTMYENEGTVMDISIAVPFGFHGDPISWGEKFRKAKKWLMSKGNHQLILEDDPAVYYKVKKVLIGEAERAVKSVGEFTATFVCEGYQYLVSGSHEVTAGNIYNPEVLAKPVYKIKGTGNCNLFINGKKIIINSSGNLTIDSDRMIAFDDAGDNKNTSLIGNYEDMWLVPGDNEISCTGAEVKIIPNLRCY